ncbi:MAG: hypothetical protein BGO67_10835 [Alphaproteobacteria bacterium 41-28]|nr:MAG: hypothetical protein BGO67_10835 [Alphaproteobacteria bacterium 41-28]
MNVSSALQIGKTDSFEEEREVLRKAFLEREGLHKTPLIPLPVDASKRRYFRLPKALLMDAPPPHEKTTPFQLIAELLNEVGLSVPLIYAADHTHGFMLIEDFGEIPYRKALQEGVCEKLLYGETLKALIHLHRRMDKNTRGLSSYDLDLFLGNATLFIDWYDLPFSDEAKSDFKNVWEEVYRSQPHLPQSLLLKDVMIDNLLWLPSRLGFNRCGFIDFQDAVWGPLSYDLVSLLEDARREISLGFAQEMLEIYFNAFPDLSRQDFWASYSLWGAQRCTRILGVFSRLAKRDGKSQYLEHLPRLWAYLERDLQHPTLHPVRQWFDTYANEKLRRGQL